MELEDLMTTPNLILDHDPATDLFRIFSATQAHQMGLISIPGCRFAGKGQQFWTIPARYAQVTALGNLFKLDWSQAAIDRYLQLSTTVDACRKLRTEGLDINDEAYLLGMLSKYGITPKPGQAAAMVQLATAQKAALFSELGSGKSLVVSGTARLYSTLPMLIIAPTSVLYNWQRELAKFNLGSVVLAGTPLQRQKIIDKIDLAATPVVICSYGMAKAHSRIAGYGNTKLKRCNDCGGGQDIPEGKCEVHERWLNTIQWQAVVVDEAHRIRDPHTAQTRAVWHLAHQTPNRWLLTNTPIEQDASEFWSLLHALDPEEHPSSSKYLDRYVLINQPPWGGREVLGLKPNTRDEFLAITQWRWRRDVKVGVPELTHEIRTCQLKPKSQKAYDQMDKQLMAEVGLNDTDETAVLSAANHMVKRGRLVQMANATVEIDGSGNVSLHEPSEKLDLWEDTMDDFPEPTICWFSSIKLLKLAKARLDAKGTAYAELHGEISALARQQAVDDFQGGKVDLLLLNPAAGGEGITLTRARVSIIVAHPDSSIISKQLEGRQARYGYQHEEMIAIHLITEGTVEEDYIPTLEAKIAAGLEVVG